LHLIDLIVNIALVVIVNDDNSACYLIVAMPFLFYGIFFNEISDSLGAIRKIIGRYIAIQFLHHFPVKAYSKSYYTHDLWFK